MRISAMKKNPSAGSIRYTLLWDGSRAFAGHLSKTRAKGEWRGIGESLKGPHHKGLGIQEDRTLTLKI
jgi:hypothetical protein